MPYLFLAALGIVLLLLLLQRLETAETKLLVKTLKWNVVGVLLLFAVYMTLVGRLIQVAVIILLLVFLLKKDFQEWMKKKEPPRSLPRPITEKEAAKLLNVDLDASPEEIEEAYKKLKPKDSTEKEKLTQARDFLLKKKD